MKNLYPFVDNPCDISELKNSQAFLLLEYLNNGGKFSDYPLKKDLSIFSELWHIEAYKTGKYKLRGWIFDFSPFMNEYLVKIRDYGWLERKSFSVTFMREKSVNESEILQVVDLKKFRQCSFDEMDD